MALQFHESPFHVTHDDETASKMALNMDLSIFITNCLKQLNLKQSEAAKLLNLTQSRVSELANGNALLAWAPAIITARTAASTHYHRSASSNSWICSGVT